MAEQDKEQTRPFADFLAQHNYGDEHREIGEAFKALVAAVDEHGKSGTLTIKISVKSMDEGRTVTTTVDHSVNAPKAAPRSQVSYLAKGNLQREDPLQMQLPLRSAETRAAMAVHSSDDVDRSDERAAREAIGGGA